jgi:hypothetical protein
MDFERAFTLLQQKRAINLELTKFKNKFTLTREECMLNKFKYAKVHTPSKAYEHLSNSYEGHKLENTSRQLEQYDDELDILDIIIYCFTPRMNAYIARSKNDNVLYFIDNWNPQFLLPIFTNYAYKYMFNDEHYVIEKFRQHHAAIKIQRCVRQWLWRPYYTSGRVGYHARRGFELMQKENTI